MCMARTLKADSQYMASLESETQKSASGVEASGWVLEKSRPENGEKST